MMRGPAFPLPTAALREAARRPAEMPAWRDVRAQAAVTAPADVSWPLLVGGLVLAVVVSRYLYRGRP